MAPSPVYKPSLVTLVDPSTLTVAATGTQHVMPHDARIVDVSAAIGTAPSDNAAVVEVRAGTTKLASVSFAVTTGTPTVTISQDTIPEGSLLNLNTTAIGGDTDGADAVITLSLEV